MANSIQRILKKEGYDTMIAPDGFHAGVMISTFSPKILTLDLKMPGLSGHEVLKFIKSDQKLKNLKFLVISAMPIHELEEAMNEGADDILSKPFKKEELLIKIKDLQENI